MIMELQTQPLADGITKISLAGRMDNAGVQGIDLQFTALTATKKALILVDLAAVSFLASIGIRTLVANARALHQRGGRMVLCSPQPVVEEVLKTAGITTIIQTFQDVGTACQALKAPIEHT
jgi:anti-sigma B factor antagonist